MIRALFSSLRVGLREARRTWTLSRWRSDHLPGPRDRLGEVCHWPVTLDPVELEEVAARVGLAVKGKLVLPANLRTRWRLTLDPASPAESKIVDGALCPRARAGVAVCVSHDEIRDVVVLEPIP